MWVPKRFDTRRIRIGPSFSFYHDFIGEYWASGPHEIEAGPIHRICSLARKMGVGQLICEDALGHDDVREEICGLEAVLAGEGEVSAVRVTFVAGFAEVAKMTSEQLIGQAVIVTFPCHRGPHSYVLEALVRSPSKPTRPRRPLLNHHFPFDRDLEIEVLGRSFSVPGSLFCQQNGFTSVCAHSTMKTIVHGASGRRLATSEINRALDAASFENGDGVDIRRISGALAGWGLPTRSYDTRRDPRGSGQVPAEATAWQLMGSQLASGSPALMTFKVQNTLHAVPILGSTLNTDEWHPNASEAYGGRRPGTASSSLWMDHLFVHDDLLGPYLAFSRASLGEAGDSGSRFMISPSTIVAIQPTAMELSAVEAEDLAARQLGTWIDMVRDYVEGGRWMEFVAGRAPRWVHRTVLVTRDEYLAHLAEDRNAMAPILAAVGAGMEAALPPQFWMCELSLPQLFCGTRRKLGEILVSGEYSDEEETCVLGLRLPSVLAWKDGGSVQVCDCPGYDATTPLYGAGIPSDAW